MILITSAGFIHSRTIDGIKLSENSSDLYSQAPYFAR